MFKGGLRVYTTHRHHDADVRPRRRVDDSARPSRATPRCALVSIDPKTGYIKAMVGGKDYNKNKFNLATQGKRQPGSSFKTFMLVTALEKGIPPYRAFDSDSPAVHPRPQRRADWIVYNSEGTAAATSRSSRRPRTRSTPCSPG